MSIKTSRDIRIILQGTPHTVDTEQIESEIRKIDIIDSIHDLHLWTIDGNYNILTIHVVLKSAQSMEQLAILKNQIRTTLSEKGIEHITVEFETKDEDCELENCCG